MQTNIYVQKAKEEIEPIIQNLKNNLNKISIGKVNLKIFDDVKVLYYDEYIPLTQISSLSSPEVRQILIRPFDLSTTKEIVRVLNSSSLDFQVSNEGDKIRITIPELTTERRKELAKNCSKYGEEARIAIRNVRHKINKEIKDVEDLPEDDMYLYLEWVQKTMDDFNDKVEELVVAKEKDLMTI